MREYTNRSPHGSLIYPPIKLTGKLHAAAHHSVEEKRRRRRRIMWMLLFLPGFRFGRAHTHTHPFNNFMSHFNGQCFECSVFHFNCNYNCVPFFGFLGTAKLPSKTLSYSVQSEQMSINNNNNIPNSSILCWISFLFSIISSPSTSHFVWAAPANSIVHIKRDTTNMQKLLLFYMVCKMRTHTQHYKYGGFYFSLIRNRFVGR